MSDLVESTKELVREGHLNTLAQRFLEPSQSRLSPAQKEALSALYDIAVKHDAADPVNWVIDYANTVPVDLQVDGETTRIGKVLVLARLYDKKKAVDAAKGVTERRRDF